MNLLGFLDAGYDTNEKSHGEWITIAAQEGTSETIGDVWPVIAFAVAVVTAWYTFRTGDLIVSVESSCDRSADARVRRHRCRPGCDWTPGAAAVARPVRVVSGASP
jgi:hypothetical protein